MSRTPPSYYTPASYTTPVESMSVDWVLNELRELNAIWSRSRSDCLNAAPENMDAWIVSLEESLKGLPPYLKCLPAFTPGHLLGTLEWSRAHYHKAALAGVFRPFNYDAPVIALLKEAFIKELEHLGESSSAIEEAVSELFSDPDEDLLEMEWKAQTMVFSVRKRNGLGYVPGIRIVDNYIESLA